MEQPDKLKIREYLILTIKGFCMGTADVIPGVSGGTMAFILGIYKELISAIRSFDSLWIKSIVFLDTKSMTSRPHFSFLLPLFFGIGIALIFFTRVIKLPELLYLYPEQINGLFFGLILGSIIILLRDTPAIKTGDVFILIAGVIFGLLVFNSVPMETPNTSWFVFLSGTLAICAMILPGISGSFVLLVLNKYTYIFNAIGYFDFSILTPFFLGAATGLVIFSRLLSYLLETHYRSTVLYIIGLLVASLWVIWPFQVREYEIIDQSTRLISSTPVFPNELTASFSLSLLMVATGLFVVIYLSLITGKKRSLAV